MSKPQRHRFTGSALVEHPEGHWIHIDEYNALLSQGEPVALPERESVGGRLPGHEAIGWNACLDEIAKLGPLYSRPVQGEPVGEIVSAQDSGFRVQWMPGIWPEQLPMGTKLYTHADPAAQPLHGFPKYGQTMLEALKQGRPFIVKPHEPADGKGYDLKLVDSCADPAEVERLRAEVSERTTERDRLRDGLDNANINIANWAKSDQALRAQLAEAQALLRRAANYATRMEPMSAKLLNQIDDHLSASAEPKPFRTPDCPECACVQDGDCLCIPSKPSAEQST